MKYYILGDIKRPVNMSRLKAERIIRCQFYSIPGKSDEECEAYENSVCVMHLDSEIVGPAPIDVDWIFSDKSLYQTADGKFFILCQGCAPYGGGMSISSELEEDYFETHDVSAFMDLLRIKSLSELTATAEEVESLFEKRKITFYAQRWRSYDYKVMFGLFGYGLFTKEAVQELVEEYQKKFKDSPDREILLAHLETESAKAFDAIEKGLFQNEHESNELTEMFADCQK